MNILTEATPIALWYEAVQRAQKDCQIALETEVESYLIYLLMRNMTNASLAREIMATRFLNGLSSRGSQQGMILQAVGDHCLLISGLFPALAEKRQVKIRYYIELGQSSYEVISRSHDDLFSALAKQFVLLREVLQSFRPYNTTQVPALLYLEKP